MAYEAGYTPSTIIHDTVADIHEVVEAHFNNLIHDMRNARVVSYTIAAANRDPKKPFPSIEKFMPLPGDPKRKAKSPSQIFKEHQERQLMYATDGRINS